MKTILEFKDHLEECLFHWIEKRNDLFTKYQVDNSQDSLNKHQDILVAVCYVDAYSSMLKALDKII